MELRKGMMAISKAGHDKDCWYVIQKLEGNKAFLVNKLYTSICCS